MTPELDVKATLAKVHSVKIQEVTQTHEPHYVGLDRIASVPIEATFRVKHTSDVSELRRVLADRSQHFRLEYPGATSWWQHVLAFLGVQRYWRGVAEFQGHTELLHGEARVRVYEPPTWTNEPPLLWRADLGL